MAFLSCIHSAGADNSWTDRPWLCRRKHLPAGVGATGDSQLCRLVSMSR